MNLIGEYLDLRTNQKIRVTDIYKNVAITSLKEKISTQDLMNKNLYIPAGSTIRESNSNRPTVPVFNSDVVDPNKFFNSDPSNNPFVDQIRSLSLENIHDDSDVPVMRQNNNTIPYQPSVSESAVVITSQEDEIEELKRKYGATSIDDSVTRQREYFSRFEDNQSEVIVNEHTQINDTQANQNASVPNTAHYQQDVPIPKIQEDPVAPLFKNIKKTLDFSIEIKIEGKIPRLDFIEMMEDSYDVSIIDYLSNEFTKNLIDDPSKIKDKISLKIKEMIKKSKGKSEVKSVAKKTPTRRRTKNDTGNLSEKSS